MTKALMAVLLLGAAAHAAPAGAPAPSTGAVAASTPTVSSVYTGDRFRDPFLTPSAGSSSSAPKPANPDEEKKGVDIHAMHLRGVLKDRDTDFALFSSDDGRTFILRAGRLYDEKNKPVPGVTGRILLKQKTVQLITADKDVQVFRLGEQEDKNKDEKDGSAR